MLLPGLAVDMNPEVVDRMNRLLRVRVPEGWTDREVQAFANRECPLGMREWWIIPAAWGWGWAGEPRDLRMVVPEHPGFVVITLGLGRWR